MVETKRSALKRARLGHSVTREERVVSTRIADELLDRIREAMKAEGYTTRKRSLWVSEAILMLKDELWKSSTEDRCQFVRQTQPVSKSGESIPITLTLEAWAALGDMVTFINTHAEEIAAAQTRLLHLAMTLRLVRGHRVNLG